MSTIVDRAVRPNASRTRLPPDPGKHLSRRLRLALGVLIACHTLAAACLILQMSVDVPGHGRYFFLHDDAMISMRYAQNLASGRGLVWNPGEYVEGFTNPLWTMYMAAVHLAPFLDERTTSLAVMLTNVLLDAGIVLASVFLAAGLLAPRKASVPIFTAAFASATSVTVLLWSVAGFETSAQTLLVTLGVGYWLRRSEDTALPPMPAFLLLALATLIRPDATVILATAIVLTTVLTLRRSDDTLRRRIRRLCLIVAPSVLVVGSVYILRLWYYGQLFPNTYYLKVEGNPDRLVQGMQYVRDFLMSGPWLALALVVVWLPRLRSFNLTALILFIGAQAAYVAYVGGDVFGEYRFFASTVPMLGALVGAWAVLVCERFPHTSFRRMSTRLSLALVCVSVALVSGWVLMLPSSILLLAYGFQPVDVPVLQNIAGGRNTALAIYLRDHVDGHPSIGVFWAGVVPYFTGWPAIDLLGKTDSYIAHLPVTAPGAPGHNKWDYAHSLGQLRPDFLLSAMTEAQQNDPSIVAEMSSNDFPFAGRLYADAQFIAQYRDRPVHYPNSQRWFGLFERADSVFPVT